MKNILWLVTFSFLLLTGIVLAQDTLPGTSTIGWQQLSNTSPSNVAASPNPGGTTAALVYAWSSGFYDRNRRRMCIWGGGHVDYAGNEFYCVQLDANPASVARMDNPSTCTSCTAAPPPCGGPGATDSTGATNNDGSPRSTHTYDSISFDPIDDLFVARSLESTWFNSCGSAKMWTLPGATLPKTNQTITGTSWSNPVSDVMNGTAVGGCGPGCATGDFDPTTQLFYYSAANLTSGLIAYNPSASQTRAGIAPHGLSTINNANVGCYNCTSVADPADKKLIQLGDSGGPFPYQNWCIDSTGAACTYGAVTRFGSPPTGCPSFSGSAPGADYDPITKTIVIWPYSGNPSGSSIYAYNPSTSARSYSGVNVPAGQCINLTIALPIAGSGPVANNDGGGSQNNGTYKRFRYVDYCDCFIVLNAFSQNFFIVRTRTHTTPNLFANRVLGINMTGGSSSIVLTSPLNGGQPMDSAVVSNCTNGGVYFGAPTPPNGSCNGTGWTLDTTTVDLDDGVTNGSWNSNILTGQASSGNIFTNFSPGCCDQTKTYNAFGLGQEFFVQYRVRYDANAISNANWPSGGGFKQDIVREEDHFVSGRQITANACAGDSPSGIDTFNGVDEIVLQEVSPTTFNPNHPFIYTHCPPVNNSEITITNPQTGHADQIDQNAAGCYHGDPFTPAQCDGGWCANDPTGSPAGNCFDYHANDWMTIQKHIIVGSAWGQCCSKIEVWAAHDQQPSQLIISLSDWILGNDDPTNGKYGKLWQDLFNTGTTGAVNPANVWYDNVVIGKRRIPDPDVGVPNAPDNLSLVNLVPSCTGATCQVQVNWRVNSQNGTVQDDEGFSVERCQPSSGVSDWVCFANQNNNNIGGQFSVITTTVPGANTYTDTGLNAGTTYVYRVRGFNGQGNSAYAASLCVRNGVGSSTPAQPWSPVAQNPCGGTITLSGTPSPTLTVNDVGTGLGTVTSNDGKINCGGTCTAAYASPSSVVLAATPNVGSTFIGWAVDGSGATCPGTGTCTITTSANHTVNSTFNLTAQSTFTLTVSEAGNGQGAVTSNDANISCPPTCSFNNYSSGASVILTETPSIGAALFGGWSQDCAGTQSTCNLTMTANRNATATFNSTTSVAVSGGTGIAVGTLQVTTASLPVATHGFAYSQQLTASGGAGVGGNTISYTWSSASGSGVGQLPPGLSLSSGGLISGTPSTIGTYSFVVIVQDATGHQGAKGLSITVN